MKTNTYLLNTLVVLLLVLWIPSSLYKIMLYEAFKSGILQQPLSYTVAWSLIYSLPALGLVTAILLVAERFRKVGLLLSSIQLILFTGYIALVLLQAWGKPPCSCGLAIPQMGWTNHLWFNLFFLAISITGYLLSTKFDKKQLRQDNNTNAKDGLFNTIT
ncbi:MauE/DoxX family redox-associated membrane protein [Sphingobacterium luzhongxinii]|uniref:MauE/DoxX family redox-associated membrane protein n=1 Tax=Sphingobacterium luzhongxinii TaxID=2654181 RepID=UPI0013DCEBE6|nr:MauE/DoxX family redox-associated membrane protein [Sphingobacterium sp. xlx-73]